MKRLLFFFACALVLLSSTHAQTKYGVTAGVNMANFSGSDADADSKIGFALGAYMHMPLSQTLFFKPEILYSMKGATSKSNSDVTINLDYIALPLLIEYPLSTSGFLTAGPEIAFLAGSTVKNGSKSTTLDDVKSIDLGIALGGGINFTLGDKPMSAALRYTMGLTTTDDSKAEADVKNSVISIMIGYRF